MYRILSFLVVLSINNLYGQDVIQKQNGVKIDATVINSELFRITYRLYNSSDTTLYSISKSELKRIIYFNGNTEVFIKPKVSPEVHTYNADGYKTYALKLNPLSPLFGHTQFSIEKQIDKNNSVEYILSVIGAGINSSRPLSLVYKNGFDNFRTEKKNQAGLSLGVGYKLFVKNQETKLNKSNMLSSGFYLRPTLYVGWLSYNSYNIVLNSNVLREFNSSFFGALVLEPGFQLIVTKDFSVDFYIGLGYMFDNIDYEKSAFLDDGFGYGGEAIDFGYSYAYSALRMSEQSPGLAMTGGVKLGWNLPTKLFKSRNSKKKK